jgi:hypothetical protein
VTRLVRSPMRWQPSAHPDRRSRRSTDRQDRGRSVRLGPSALSPGGDLPGSRWRRCSGR